MPVVILSQMAGFPMSWTVTLIPGCFLRNSGTIAFSALAGSSQLQTVMDALSLSPAPPVPAEPVPEHAESEVAAASAPPSWRSLRRSIPKGVFTGETFMADPCLRLRAQPRRGTRGDARNVVLAKNHCNLSAHFILSLEVTRENMRIHIASLMVDC
ncbi:hypothetical protein ACFWMG_23895 [Streptomyces sp. NPDC127074]|uniref:hypothetical protein n=1 Tax=Streptomyces sp. NPDC127074 TaxID=3347130 RepID=UPI003654A425